MEYLVLIPLVAGIWCGRWTYNRYLRDNTRTYDAKTYEDCVYLYQMGQCRPEEDCEQEDCPVLRDYRRSRSNVRL